MNWSKAMNAIVAGLACLLSAAAAPAAEAEAARPKRVLILLGENFDEIEFAAFSGVLAWASHTRRASNGVLRRAPDAAEVRAIEVVVAGFDREVNSMGSMHVRPDVLVRDLKDDEIDRFDAVAIPACVGTGRGRRTDKGQQDLLSDRTVAIVRRVHERGGIIALMCWGQELLRKAKLLKDAADYPLYTDRKDGAFRPLVFDKETRTITSGGPCVAIETACLLLRRLVSEAEYRSFRQHNPWLFGIRDEFPPRLPEVK